MSRPSSTAARTSKADAAGIPVLRGRMVADVAGGKGVKAVHLDRSHAHHLRCGRHVRRLEPHRQSRVPSRRQADVGCEPSGLPAARRRRRPSRSRVPPRARCCSRSASPMAPPRARSTASPIAVPTCRDEAFCHLAAVVGEGESTARPSSITRTTSTAKDLPLAAREGYKDIELAKRYTTTGMATDQGKLGNVNAIAILAEATGRSHGPGRHHHVPALLHAGRLRRLRRSLHRASLPAGAQDAAA